MPQPAGSTTVTIRNIRKTFPSTATGGTTVAVDDISLTIEAGELFFLLGPSGCGKTTLLRMIAGFIEPTSGQILVSDGKGERDITWLPPNKRNTGMVFQSYALWPHMTVAQNVGFGLEVRKISGKDKQDRIMDALRSVRMDAYAARKPNQLSGGQQQRIALARAMVIRPSVLLLDEPLSNLDAKLRIELRSEIRRICKESGITTIYVTHDQKEALSMADRVAILEAGHVVQLGTPEELYRRPASRFVAEFLGETNIIPGRIVDTAPEGALIETPAGRLRSATPPPAGHEPNSQVLVSIRPESLAFANGEGANTLAGRLTDTTYLGEVAQHTVALTPEVTAKVAVLNPAAVRRGGGDVTLRVDPADVVLLPAAPPTQTRR